MLEETLFAPTGKASVHLWNSITLKAHQSSFLGRSLAPYTIQTTHQHPVLARAYLAKQHLITLAVRSPPKFSFRSLGSAQVLPPSALLWCRYGVASLRIRQQIFHSPELRS